MKKTQNPMAEKSTWGGKTLRQKLMKRIISITLCMAMVFSVGAVSAADVEGAGVANSYFTNYITGLFKTPSEYTVHDTNNRDVTDSFYERNTYNYNTNNFDAIRQDVQANVSQIIHTETEPIVNNGVQPRAYVNANVSQQIMRIIEASRNGIIAGRKEELYFTISGNYVFARGNLQIISCGNSTFTIDYSTFGQWWDYELSNIYTNSRIASDGFSVDFTAGFSIMAKLILPLGELQVGPYYDFGSVSATITGYPSEY